MTDDDGNVNLRDYQVDKLLGSGQVNQAFSVTVEHASAKAIEKIEAAGGSVTLSGDDDNEWEED
jgi:large subunit ribosomal protein L15